MVTVNPSVSIVIPLPKCPLLTTPNPPCITVLATDLELASVVLFNLVKPVTSTFSPKDESPEVTVNPSVSIVIPLPKWPFLTTPNPPWITVLATDLELASVVLFNLVKPVTSTSAPKVESPAVTINPSVSMVTLCPKWPFLLTPKPPVAIKDPVVFDEDWVTLVIVVIPKMVVVSCKILVPVTVKDVLK